MYANFPWKQQKWKDIITHFWTSGLFKYANCGISRENMPKNRVWHFIRAVSWWNFKYKFHQKSNFTTRSGLIQPMAKWWHFSYFLQKISFDISCKLSPQETICMKCQNLFSVKKKKKDISRCRLLKFYPRPVC